MALRELRAELRAWAGPSTDALGNAYERHASKPRFVADLLRLAGEPETEVPATWILRRRVEQAEPLSRAQTKRLVALLPALERWEARLHVLQCVPSLDLTAADARALVPTVGADAGSPHNFVRAWAVSALCDVARVHDEHAGEARRALAAAARDPSAAVRARVRRLRARGG